MKKKNRGVVLIIALLIIMVLAILSTALLSRSIAESRHTWRFVYMINAFWIAEAGLQLGLYEMNNGNGSWNGWTDIGGDKHLQASLTGMGDFDVTVSAPASTAPQVSAIGYFPGRASPDVITRSLRGRLYRSDSIFTYAAFGGTAVRLGGQGSTDSYDSSAGPYDPANPGSNGDVGTNGDITASGLAYIDGDASTGESGTFSDTSKVSGTITNDSDVELAIVAVPENLQTLVSGGALSSTTTISAGDYKYHSINIASKTQITIVGPANIYLTGSTSIDISALSQILISSASTGPVKIYFDGDISLSGQGIVNATQLPSQLLLYGTNSTAQNISITGQGDFYGALYAPTASMDLSGQGALFGSFVGDTVDITGQGGVHYDEQLADVPTGSERFIIGVWQDTQNLFPVTP